MCALCRKVIRGEKQAWVYRGKRICENCAESMRIQTGCPGCGHSIDFGENVLGWKGELWHAECADEDRKRRVVVSTSATQQPVVKEIITREIVKIRCRHCNGLMDEASSYCPRCGAPS